VVHEYHLEAAADAATMTIAALNATPRVLPYAECPAAASYAGGIVGQRLADLRMTVLTTLTGTHSCTHLNDMLRALAEVPQLCAKAGLA
jgi:Protein of unknown function (DUF2889)